MTRGRLLFWFLADLRRRDPQKTRYDPDFRESVVVGNNEGPGTPDRAEHPALLLPCQVEPERDDEQRPTPAGGAPASRLGLVFHFADLERRGLVDPDTGAPLLRAGDRLAGLYTRTGGLVRRFVPGLYAVEVRSIGWGLGGTRNLALMLFHDRPQAAGRSMG